MTSYLPRYLKAHQQGDLLPKAQQALKGLSDCTLCPRRCGVDRTSGETGFCRTGHRAVVASYNAHFGEEAPLVGHSGSGTIFFSHCNLLCNFCQNYDISHLGVGQMTKDNLLADIMLTLQAAGCHNINFVTPSHVVPQILSALVSAAQRGLSIPLVYNSSGYDSVETLKILDGIIDIYMPDFKFWDPHIAEQTCRAPDYPQAVRDAISEMHRQVGDLTMDTDGLAVGGLLIRHLVLPQGLADTYKIMKFIADRISTDTYVNIMPQYRPWGQAAKIKPLNQPITDQEYAQALEDAKKAGIHRLDRRRRTFMLH
jgi:putative pyruvate formate lyase activating enzyme